MEDQIKELEEEIKSTPYNKATQKHIGLLKAKLARLREGAQQKSGGKAGISFSVRKEGDATVLLVGLPSAGKSTLINAITNAESKTAEYDFTTLDVIPGMMEHNGAKIQILDVPGLIEGASRGRGLGKKILSAVRNADMILMLIDGTRDMGWQLGLIRTELYKAGFRLDRKRPDIKITKKSTGGISIGSGRLTKIDRPSIEALLKDFKILNADVVIRDDITADDLVDALMGNRMYVPSLIAVNKSDIMKGVSSPEGSVIISARNKENMKELIESVWEKLGLIRVYMKRIGRPADMEAPLIVKEGSTVLYICKKIHRELARDFSRARIWGPSARFPGQRVGMDMVLQDKDIIELHKK